MSPTLNHQPNFNWQEIETVLLDMDGTLLDLEFDSYFWLNLVPQTLSERRGITLDEAKKLIHHEYNAVQHTLNWYCFDYWSDRLDLDIYQMTSEVGARARLRQDTQPFLEALRASGRKTILLTNAHPHGLAVKLQHTGLDQHLDLLFSTHTFGYPKEDQRLWQAVQKRTGFNPATTLFVDDAEPILDAAQSYGIRYCLGVRNPDSSMAEKQFSRHPSMNDYRTLLPAFQPQ
ncbi:nucleotidase [Hafnia alvei]|uniref:GMP/IMP nucleotidase n=1 Tax=Hafnia alvei TaxID=569 RepID=UPI000583BDE3|nr:GMP/IMP nucleotidase [Hafnia alvei]KID00217.1 nucleotidase [Hafnia alvei]